MPNIIPLTSDADQNLKCVVPLSNQNLSLFFRDLLGQFQHLGFGSAMVINAGNGSLDSPDDSTLGSDFVLVWG